MEKILMITAPVTSRSGYGDHARDLVKSFMAHNKYDIYIHDVRWGETPRNALDKNNTEDKKMLDLFLSNTRTMPRQPELYVDIRIPNEFERFGKYNIGITAGIETTAVSNNWIQKCNDMDLIIVPSEHSKRGFVNSIYDKFNNGPDGKQQKVGELKLEKPIEVLFEGVDDDVYKPLHHKEIDTEFFDWLNSEVPEKFAFLQVGLWGKGGYGEDRKDISKLIKVFYESFANKKKQPALILKTSGATFSTLNREECMNKIREVKDNFPSEWNLPNVYLLHGDLTKEEMNYLYNHPKVKAMVSFTHGEGFGRPLLEASMTGLPVITTGWSGQLDFLNENESILLNGELKQVPASQVWKDILIKESQWFNVNEKDAFRSLLYAFQNNEDLKRNSNSLMGTNREKFTLDKMIKKLDKIMEKHTENMPTQVGLNLPKLKKVSSNTKEPSKKIKLPKLKKIKETV